jgi:putative membrane protein
MSELNDPRVFFAAERTLLAWNRTALSLMAFGFVIERFGLADLASLWIGVAFILMGAVVSVISVLQYRGLLSSLKPIEIPVGHSASLGIVTNLAVAALGVALTGYLLQGAL